MNILQPIFDAFTCLFGSRESVSDHHKRQAYGPKYSQRRSRHIGGYSRRRPRSNWR